MKKMTVANLVTFLSFTLSSVIVAGLVALVLTSRARLGLRRALRETTGI